MCSSLGRHQIYILWTYAWLSALLRSCLGEPELQRLGDAGQLSHLHTAQHREHTFLGSRKAAAGPLTPAGHVAGQKNWEWAQENGTILD
uniref:Secreted protein n=1 Tax=Gallus gallus TaxID=9031 RepID=A0A8V0ZFV4_CHICK